MNVAIVGASGAVGRELLKLMEGFPVDSLRLFGSSRSAGSRYNFHGESIEVEELGADSDAFQGVDVAFTSAGSEVSAFYADTICRHGAVMIDNSSAFRLDPEVPLVVPEVNGDDALRAPRRIIANPNCTTIQMVMVLWPLHKLSAVKRVHVATYQAASGAGARAMEDLKEQYRVMSRGEEPADNGRFAHRLAYNLIPHIDTFTASGYTREEMKMYHETKRIMHAPTLEVSAMCVRVPVLRAHSEAMWIETERALSPDEARYALAAAPGVQVVDNPDRLRYPMPKDAEGRDPVYVGRIRPDLTNPNGITLWCSADQIRKGAALNAVQIARVVFGL